MNRRRSDNVFVATLLTLHAAMWAVLLGLKTSLSLAAPQFLFGLPIPARLAHGILFVAVIVLVTSGLCILLLIFLGPRPTGRSGDPGRCPTCGYDLRATPDRCPECGMVAAARSEGTSGKSG